MNITHAMPFGAALKKDGGVEFRLWAPAAKTAQVLVDDQPVEARAEADGWYTATVASARAGTRYEWLIDGEEHVPDPASRSNPQGPNAASEVVDALTFEWDEGWTGRPWHEAAIYELHVGSFTHEGTYAAAEPLLQGLCELGITAIELMPLSTFAGHFGWGYDGVLPYAPHPAYGTPDQLKHCIQTAHRQGLMVMLDVVYNHFGPDGNRLDRYAPQFQSSKHETPWGAAMNFDGDDARWVREFTLQNALYWLAEYRFDGLRIDAVHAMIDDGSPHIIEALSQRVRASFPDRHIHIVLENDHNNPARLGPPATPGRCEGQWNGDFHQCLHVLTTGETESYYAEYKDDPVGQLARVLTDGFAREGAADDGQHGGPRQDATGPTSLLNTVNFLQCHDQVGNRAFGERLAAIAAPGLMPVSMALLLMSPSVPMLFMGEEFASNSPFLYFCDAREDMREAIRAGRREEFHDAPNGADLSGQVLPDPCSVESFERSVIESPADWSGRQHEWHAWCTGLLRMRRQQLVPYLPLLLEALHELLQRVRADQLLAGMLGDELVRHAGGAVEHAHLEAAALDVEYQVLPHHGQADQSEIACLTFGVVEDCEGWQEPSKWAHLPSSLVGHQIHTHSGHTWWRQSTGATE